MAGELMSFGIQKLWDILSQEFERFQGVEEQVTGLKLDLNWLSSFLKDAYAKKHTSAVVKNCVEEIKEIVYDAEDIIETYLLKEKLRKTSGIKMSIRRHACFISDHRKNALDIAGIRMRISAVIRNMQSFGVQQIIADGGYRLREMRQTFPSGNESDLQGLKGSVQKLVGYLVEDDNIQVVSITGMGGVGKTTLARKVFNHEDVKHQFERLAWVCVSQEFTKISVWQTILQNLTSKERKDKDKILKMKEAELQDELFQLLETSKSLIVFDDIWREEDWDLMKPIFPKEGWKVLLTSRIEFVSRHGDMRYINFKPECLTFQDSWKLFKRIAMPRKDAPEFKEMKEKGKKMIKHCGGLPLAIKVLGGLLAAKYTLHDWKRLSENIGSNLMGGRTDFNDDNNNSFNYVLSLSFEELPSYLRCCFLYLAHFPENHKIDVEKLSYYWAAEGIIEPREYDGETIRDVGDSYIKELVRRNMVIPEREATTSRFETCHLHDMMREVCLFKARKENFLQIASSRPSTASFQSHVTSRRLVSHNPTTLHVERDIKNPKLRSLVLVPGEESCSSWKLSGSSYTRLELLRVLDLSGAVFEGGKLPSGIGKLIHLRYLSLEGAEVSRLPSSLGNLLLLIYLNLDTKGYIFVPNVLMGMQELRYLALPNDMHKKTKLELGKLQKLETLLHFSTENSNVRDLDRMTKLRTLSINTRGEGCAIETLSSSLSELRRLENLTICLTTCWLVEDPMPVLEKLVPILEKLVQLKDLKIESQHLSGRRMVCSRGGFPKLHALELSELEEWEEWIVEEGSMPLLHTLEIRECPKLKKLPAGGFPQLQELLIFELNEWEEWIVEEGSMPLLHTLKIRDCKKLKKLPASRFPQLQELILYHLEEWEEWIVEKGSMPLLHFLYIFDCPKLRKLKAGGFPQLQRLELYGLKEWEEWIVEEGSMPLLHYLDIFDCPKLKKLPAGGFPKLHTLYLDGLKEWEEWIVEEGSMPLLHTLKIFDCKKLKKLPAGGFPQLHKLYLDRLEEWEEWIVEEGSMPFLGAMSIWNCPKLKKLTGGFPQLHTLLLLGLKEWEEWIVEEGSMPLLQYLQIGDCPKLKKLPARGLPQLHTLKLDGLKEWEELKIEEGSMPLLHTLEISDCEKLEKLPDGLSFIKELKIDKEWKESLSVGGDGYYKFKHIPSVKFNKE